MSKLPGFLQKLWHQDLNTGKLKRTWNKVLRVMVIALRKFNDDRCLLWTSSISYAVVISFVPTLIAVLMFGAAFVNIDVFFNTIHEQASQLGLDVDLYQYKDPIQQFIDTAAKVIGGIGIFVTLWSATNVFRNIESALNFIWRIKNKRSLFFKITQFVIALVFGLPLLTLGLTMTNSILNSFRAPDLHSAVRYGQQTFVLGNKGYIARVDEKEAGDISLESVDYTTGLDYEGQSAAWFWNLNEEREAYHNEVGSNELPPIAPADIERREVSVYLKTPRTELIVLDSGVILQHKNGRFHMRRYGVLRRGESATVTTYKSVDLTFTAGTYSAGRILLFASDGFALLSDDHGKTFRAVSLPVARLKVTDIDTTASGRMFAVGENNLLMSSDDNGTTWQLIKAFDKKMKLGRFFNYHDIYTRGNRIYIAGSRSNLLFSSDNGTTWERSLVIQPGVGSIDLRSIYFSSNKKGFVFGKRGFTRYTDDGGGHWYDMPVPENAGFSHFISFDDALLGIGPKMQTFLFSPDDIKQGVRRVGGEDRLIGTIGNILNFAATFMVIWVLFMVVYIWMPYTRVSIRAASIGAGFTSVVWVAFIFIFTFYANNLAGNTLALYGALAGIPLGLLLIYSSTAITLLGAQLSYVIQYPQTWQQPDDLLELERSTDYIWYGFLINLIIHHDHHTGNSPTPKQVLLRALNDDQLELNSLLEVFIEAGYIAENNEEETFLPMKASSVVKLDDLYELTINKSSDIPNIDKKNTVMKKMEGWFNDIKKARTGVWNDLTIEDVLPDFELPAYITRQ